MPVSALTLELPEGVSREKAQLALAIRLFETGKVSLGRAAVLADLPKRVFMDKLEREGVPVVNYPAGEQYAEFSA